MFHKTGVLLYGHDNAMQHARLIELFLFMNIISKSLEMLSPRERRSGLLLLGLSVLKGLADLIGVASILPFLRILSEPDLVEGSSTLARVYDWFGFQSTQQFLLVLGIVVIVVLVISAAFRALTVYAINRWTEMREYYLSRRLLETYLRQPYEYYLDRNTSDMATAILNLARNVVIGVYKPVANIINSVITFLLIAGFLVYMNPMVTLAAVASISACYIALYIGLRGLIKRIGELVVRTNKARFRAVGETLTGVKQVKLAGREQFYLDEYARPALEQARARALSATLGQVPRFGLEVVAFGGIIVLTLVLFQQGGGEEGNGAASALPLLGLYALASYRIMPLIQIIYGSMSTLRMSGPVVDAVYEDMENQRSLPSLPRPSAEHSRLFGDIVFENVSYTYPSANSPGIQAMSFEIKRGMSVGIVGSTGAGKTTLIDLFLGLLEPSGGQISIDGTVLTKQNIRNWQASIGYVPQEIHLNDTTVARNIAMGVAEDEISQEKLEKAAKLAHIHEFIMTELEDGYATEIGERGVRLSGGQRQRFGIARALYHDAPVIVFDEATSALDNATEADVMAAIDDLSKEKTILMIAHRLTTIENCDMVLVLEKGRLAAFDTYDRVVASNGMFKKLAAKSGN